MSNQQVSRRDILAASGAFAAVAAAAGSVSAADGHAHHMMHGAHKNQAVIDAALDCVKKGSLCMDHCLLLFKAKDTSVADCANTVNEMLPMCDALAKLTMADSPLVADLAKVCIKACENCEKECRKHEDTHAECKACAESCAACIKACKAIAA